MSEVKWIKIVTDIFDDEKILLIESMPEADSIIVIWFKLLCLAGKNNNNGVFMLNDRIHYTDEMFATIFRRNLNTVRLALNTFEQFGMIEIINNTVTIPNWEKHQQLDALEAGRENTRKRVAKHREKQKMLALGVGNVTDNVTDDVTDNVTGNVTDDVTDNVTGNVTDDVTVTPGNADRIDKNRIDKKEIYKEKERDKRVTFTPPTIEDVQDYANEKGWMSWEFQPERFIDYYASKGWMVGKSKMIDWKAAARNWKRNVFNNTNQDDHRNRPRLDTKFNSDLPPLGKGDVII